VEAIVDSAGNEYSVGAIVRMNHFRTASKKYYMYKQVTEINEKKRRVGFAHLPIKDKVNLCFSLSEGEVKNMTVIVEATYEDQRELRRNSKIRD